MIPYCRYIAFSISLRYAISLIAYERHVATRIHMPRHTTTPRTYNTAVTTVSIGVTQLRALLLCAASGHTSRSPGATNVTTPSRLPHDNDAFAAHVAAMLLMILICDLLLRYAAFHAPAPLRC